MPSRKQIVSYWLERCEAGARPPGPFLCESDDPEGSCWACGTPCRPDRAHIVDRFMGDGLDGPQNMTLLCKGCHSRYPIITAPDIDIAFAWLNAQMPYINRFLHQNLAMIEELGHERILEFFS